MTAPALRASSLSDRARMTGERFQPAEKSPQNSAERLDGVVILQSSSYPPPDAFPTHPGGVHFEDSDQAVLVDIHNDVPFPERAGLHFDTGLMPRAAPVRKQPNVVDELVQGPRLVRSCLDSRTLSTVQLDVCNIRWHFRMGRNQNHAQATLRLRFRTISAVRALASSTVRPIDGFSRIS